MQAFNIISNHPVIVKHGPTLALIGTGGCLLLFLLTTGLDMKAQAKVKAETYTPKPIQPIKKNQRTKYRINDVVKANLFGNPAPKTEIKNAPKTTLDLTLQGILSASDNSVARAIITSSQNKKAQLYSIGDEIKGAGASIKEIRAFEIILNRNGAIESLPLKKKKSKDDSFVFSTASTATKNDVSSRETRDTSTKDKPRKIRKPNFSGLDRALEKLNDG